MREPIVVKFMFAHLWLAVLQTGDTGLRSLRRRMSRNCRGFTLVELLVVVAIIGLLASFVAPRLFRQVDKSEVQLARAQIDAFQKALDAFRLDTGHYPNASQGLSSLVSRPEGERDWRGPYLQKAVPSDPWGRPYVYRSPGDQGRDYELLSMGKNGVTGGSGDDADITSW